MSSHSEERVRLGKEKPSHVDLTSSPHISRIHHQHTLSIVML
jgi:hypothetical protein